MSATKQISLPSANQYSYTHGVRAAMQVTKHFANFELNIESMQESSFLHLDSSDSRTLFQLETVHRIFRPLDTTVHSILLCK